VIALLKACPNVINISITPYFGRSRIGERFRWLDALHDCKHLRNINFKQVLPNVGAHTIPFLWRNKLPHRARLSFWDFGWEVESFKHTAWRHLPSRRRTWPSRTAYLSTQPTGVLSDLLRRRWNTSA
jgi:hypothetical protein